MAEAFKNTFRNFIVLPSAKYYDEALLKRLQSIGISPARAHTLAEHAGVGGAQAVPVAEIIHGAQHRFIPIGAGPITRLICGSTSELARKRFARILLDNDGRIGPSLIDLILEQGGPYAESWAARAAQLVAEYDALRQQQGVTPPRYDPAIFDSDIHDISPVPIAS
jgi:hypothetical protein